MNVVDSPPGTTRPSSASSCSGLRTSTTSAPRRRSIAACSRKFPWTARTPILSGSMRLMLSGRRFLQQSVGDVEDQPAHLEAGREERTALHLRDALRERVLERREGTEAARLVR